MLLPRLTTVGLAALIALSAAVPGSAPVSAASVGPALAAPAAPGLTQVHDFLLNTAVACRTGYEFPQFFSSPAVADLFGDGRKEIIAGFPDGKVHAWYADTYAELPGWPKDAGDNVASSPTVAVLDGDTLPSVIVSSYSGWVHIWDRAGTERGGWPRPNLFNNPGAGIQNGFFSSVAVGDAFGDGRRELFATALDQHTYAWFSNGVALPGWPKLTYDTGLATPALADLQHNGTLSIVAPHDSSGLYGVFGGVYSAWSVDGRQLWARGYDEAPWASPAITDFGDGDYVTVNGTGHFYNKTRSAANGKYIVGINQAGADRYSYPAPTNDVTFASPAVGDLIGNGGREVVDVTEGGTLYAFDGHGAAVPGFPRTVPGGHVFAGGVAIAPVDATGQNGIYAATTWGLAVYSMSNLGSPTQVLTPSNAIVTSTPTIADLGGGHLSVLVGSASQPQNCGQASTYHITMWSVGGTNPAAMGASSWPTFHGNMRRTGSNIALPPVCNNPSPSPDGAVAVNSINHGLMTRSPSTGSFCTRGGLAIGAPAVTAVPSATPGQPGTPLYVVTGNDHDLWIRGEATGWQRVGSIPLYCMDSPGAAVYPSGGSNMLVVACKGGDGGLWYSQAAVTPGSIPVLSGWQSLGGSLAAGPAVAVVNGQLTFFVTGVGPGFVWIHSPSGWSATGWMSVGHPALATSGGVSYFACHGSDGGLWFSINKGPGWSPAASAGGSLVDGPGIIAGASSATLLGEGTDRSIWSVPVSSAGLLGGWQGMGGYSETGAAGSAF